MDGVCCGTLQRGGPARVHVAASFRRSSLTSLGPRSLENAAPTSSGRGCDDLHGATVDSGPSCTQLGNGVDRKRLSDWSTPGKVPTGGRSSTAYRAAAPHRTSTRESSQSGVASHAAPMRGEKRMWSAPPRAASAPGAALSSRSKSAVSCTTDPIGCSAQATSGRLGGEAMISEWKAATQKRSACEKLWVRQRCLSARS